MSEKRITVISTGGTIAMGADPKSGTAVPLLSGEALITSLPSLKGIARVNIIDYCNKPGTHLTLNDVLELSKLVNRLFDKNETDGIVITHGTDTLEETAYALDLLVPGGSPVIVTGAMRNASQPGYDGPVNLFNSILTASVEAAREKGALVVFNNEIHLARDVTKVSATQVNAFRSPLFGPVGVIYGQKVQLVRTGGLRDSIPIKEISARVELIKFTLGMSNLLLEAIEDSSLDGMVIEGAGVGHVSTTAAAGIKKIIGAGKIVVLSSRCYEGLVLEDSYGFEGSEKSLRESGVIMAPGLNGLKARIKLVLALSFTRDREKIRSLFNSPIEYG